MLTPERFEALREELWEIKQGDALSVLKTMPEQSVHCCVTSPPYWGLRDYGVDGQLGLESTPDEYVEKMVEVFREVRRVLRDDGTLWLNLGDSYAGSGKGAWDNKEVQKEVYVPDKDSPQCKLKKVPQGLKPKDLIGIPWMVAFALRADGWYLRQDIIWHKPNPMPESVTDRCTKAHEYIFLLTKRKKYFYDAEAIKEKQSGEIKTRRFSSDGGSKARAMGKHISGGNEGTGAKWTDTGSRNKRSVWTIATKPFKEAHFAVFPPDLIEPCILAGTSPRACEICGAPWKRVVEREQIGKHVVQVSDRKELLRNDLTKYAGSMGGVKVTTLGWEPTCACQNEGKGRCIVLDPFMGSGTTGMVAAMHQRNFIGFELNPEYCKMAEKRIEPYLMQQTIFELLKGGHAMNRFKCPECGGRKGELIGDA